MDRRNQPHDSDVGGISTCWGWRSLPLLAGSKLDTYHANPYFLMKLSLLVLIGIHGLIFRPTVYRCPADLDRTPQPPLRTKLAGGLSLVPWLSVLTCGRWIAYYDAPK